VSGKTHRGRQTTKNGHSGRLFGCRDYAIAPGETVVTDQACRFVGLRRALHPAVGTGCQEPDPSNSLKRCAGIWDFGISTPKTSGKARPDSRQRKNEQPIRAERKHARAAISTAMSRAAPNAARRQCLPTILRALQSTRNGVAATDSPGALRFWPATSMRSTREGRLGV
jgi:hypothetical protein